MGNGSAGGKDTWDKLEALSKIIAAVLVPLVIAIVGNTFAGAMKQRELDARFAEVALNILARPPNAAEAADSSVRTWAAKLVGRYSGIDMGAEATKSVVERTALPLPSMTSTGTYRYAVGNGPVRLTVSIGNAQLGRSQVFLADDLLADGEITAVAIGLGREVAGQVLRIVTTVVDVNSATDRLAVGYSLEGGPRDYFWTLEDSGSTRTFTTVIALTSDQGSQE